MTYIFPNHRVLFLNFELLWEALELQYGYSIKEEGEPVYLVRTDCMGWQQATMSLANDTQDSILREGDCTTL